MGYGNYIIGMLLFITVAGVLFTSMADMSSKMGVDINSSYIPGYTTQSTAQNDLTKEIADQAPGGENGVSPGSTSTANFDYGLGYSTASSLGKISSNFKEIVFGNSSSDEGAIVKQFGIPSVWGTVFVTIFILSMALLGIGIILNRYL